MKHHDRLTHCDKLFFHTMFVIFLVLAALGLSLLGPAPRSAHAAVYPCTEAGLNAAIAAGGGPHTFSCASPAMITITSTKLITTNVILDGEGRLTISGNNALRVFDVAAGRTLELHNLTVTRGRASPSDGGGIRNNGGTVILVNSTLSYNSGYNFGGGIWNNGGTVNVIGSTLNNNSANVYGGGIANSGGTVSLTNSRLATNDADIGGGIYNISVGRVTLTNCTLDANDANDGGGIWSDVNGTVVLINSTLSGNHAHSIGGGIRNGGTLTISGSTLSGNRTDSLTGGAGGIFNTGNMTVTNSTFSANTVQGWAGGGGLYNTGTITITNSTFSGNYAMMRGGGISNAGTMTITNSTLSGNRSTDGGGIYIRGGTISATNTLVARGTAGTNCFVDAGTLTGTASLSDDGSCPASFTQVSTAQLNLGVLSGSPAYYPLLSGSVAIDTGTNAGCPTTDQRGGSRPADGDGNGTATCDVGAYEFPSQYVSSGPSGPTAADHARAQAPLCADLDGSTNSIIRAAVPDGTVPYGGVYCRVIAEDGQYRTSPAEVGIQSVLDRGVIQAVDVFGLVGGDSYPRFEHSVRTCLLGSGVFLFLDATTAPRTVSELPVSSEGGYSCATIPNAGTVVLVQGTPGVTASTGSAIPLSGCMVTTRRILNLRDNPDGTVITQVPYDVTLTATQRQDDWFNVDYLGTPGWLSAAYVTPNGACGP